MPQALKKERYTYEDYITWPDDERWEIINGEAYCMSPAPKIRHQKILSKLDYEFSRQLKRCFHFIAPVDVVFDRYNIVQPDLFVVCSRKKITEDNIQGAPDLIIEITSQTTELKDRREKKNLYERFKVKEYIIINPESEYVEQYILDKGRYRAPKIYGWNEVLKSSILPVELNLWEIFGKKRPENEKNRD